MELVVVEKGHYAHGDYADHDEYQLTDKEVVAVALGVVGEGIARREHHDRSYCQQNEQDYAERQVDSHADSEPLGVLHLSLTRGSDEELLLLRRLRRLVLIVVDAVNVALI